VYPEGGYAEASEDAEVKERGKTWMRKNENGQIVSFLTLPKRSPIKCSVPFCG
jgi:hypothetical protein